VVADNTRRIEPTQPELTLEERVADNTRRIEALEALHD
jgi:hypothetical protein